MRLRALLAGLLLAFVLNTVAHAAHQHEAAAASTAIHSICGYCASVGGTIDLPVHSIIALSLAMAVGIPSEWHTVVISRQPQTSARPRAPPLS